MAKVVDKPTKAKAGKDVKQMEPKWEQVEPNCFKRALQLYTVKIYTHHLIQQFKKPKNIHVHQKTEYFELL